MMYHTIADRLQAVGAEPVYVLCGRDRYFIERTVALLREYLSAADGELNYEKYNAATASLSEIISAANTLTFFGGKRLVLVDDAPWFTAAHRGEAGVKNNSDEQQALLDYLADPCASTVLIFIVNGIVSRNMKTVKAAEKCGMVAEFSVMTGAAAEKWVSDLVKRRGKQIDRRAVSYILLSCDNNFAQVEQEVEKLVLHAGTVSDISLADAEQLVSPSITTNIFNLIDSVAAGQLHKSLTLLDEVLISEDINKIIPLLAGQFHLIYICTDLKRQGYSQHDIMKTTGKNYSFIIEKALRQGMALGEANLKRALHILLAADLKGKSGITSQREALENAIIQICMLKK